MSAAGSSDVDVMPALPLHALSPIHSTTSNAVNDQEEKTELNRSASFSYLSSPSRDGTASIKRTFSENVLSLPTNRYSKVNDSMQTANKELFRRASRKTKKRMSTSKFTLPADDEDSEKDGHKSNGDNGDSPKGLTRSMTGTIRSLARKSWISTSRSSSPAKQDELVLEKKRSWSPAKKAATAAADSIAVPKPVASRSPSPSQRGQDDQSSTSRMSIQSEPAHSLSSMSLRNKSESSFKRFSRRSSFSSLKSQASFDKMRKGAGDEKVPPLPPSLSSDRLSTLNMELKRKDPLWTAFRAIEGEYTTFQSKTSIQKAKVIRTSLLPFLAKYADHASNKSLRAEDLDRRVVILNKWWTGLLEMLSGRNNQSITGTDRPAFLEAASQIMMRPEWKIPPFLSTGDTPKPPSIRVEYSTASLKSDESDFLVESIHQNVRNIFVQNLLSQIAFVVEKLSMRSAPASLVTFGGKACAYAFFFCPGMADMLVRLWRIPPSTLRRIFAEGGVERGEKLDLVSKALTSQFPAPVRSLAVDSQTALSRNLQMKKHLPPGTEHVMWHGPWIGRWSGRDSDLFFVFTKWYHILVSEFLQDDISSRERVCIPGFAPIHAQILTVLETTVYRQAGQQSVDNYASGTASGLDNPDALAPLPMTIANASRQIAENRLVILLRDVLGDRDPSRYKMQELYASSFGNVVKAATRKISLYNNDACFVLCDFMEEIFPIMARHYQNDTPYLEWPFWLKVCKQMMQSHNTLTQIRLIAFVYSTWSILISNDVWKRDLILDWLLEQEFFDQHFCHWSPMVRHYFFRLLCWRVGRCDGDPSALDIEILETLSARLNRCWGHYQYLSAEADMRDLCPPSSAPCSPAPSRGLVIIRTDSQPLPPGAFSSFDRFFSQGLLNQTTPYQKHSSVLNTIPSADPPTQNGNKKRWSLLRNMLPFGSTPGNNRPGEVTPPASPDEGGPQLGSVTDVDGEKPISRPVTPPHQPFSFKFSLEWVDNRNAAIGKNRRLVAPLLPTNAQRILERRRTSVDRSSTSSDERKSTPRKRGEIKPVKPLGRELDTARYSGRALAEWAQVLMECRNFYLRRKQEGVPRDGLVETPTLGVETFRMIG